MNLKLFTRTCSLFLAASVLLTACEKEGPPGPAGAQGPAGPQGPTGPQGPQGNPGTANVIYSNWLDVTFEPDTEGEGAELDTLSWSAVIPAAKLTADLLNNGEVKVFLNAGTAAQPIVVPLPLDALLFQLILSPIYTTGNINLIASDDASTFTNTAGAKSWQYRYILIPGGTGARAAANINWNNYAEVKAYLGLKD